MATTARSWKKKNKDDKKLHDVSLPSGNVAQVRRPGPELFVRQGLVPNGLLQMVLPLLEDAKKQGAKGDTSEIPEAEFAKLQEELLSDPSKFADMITMVDNITLACVVQPKVWPASKREEIMAQEGWDQLDAEAQEAALDEYLFVDEVDFEDKMMIFQFAVGGTADLERFRLGTESAVAARQASAEV